MARHDRPDAESDGGGETFGAWLVAQTEHAGWIGGLAKAAKADRRFPRSGDADAVRRHLNQNQAESDMLEAIDDAEGEWLRR